MFRPVMRISLTLVLKRTVAWAKLVPTHSYLRIRTGMVRLAAVPVAYKELVALPPPLT